MWPVLNLRHDLAKLDDAVLATRCEAAWAEVKTFGSLKVRAFRGPIRHPRAYVFWGVFRMSGGGPLDALASALVATADAAATLTNSDKPRLFALLCEIEDIVDEMKSRTRSPPAQVPSRPESI